VSDSGVLIEFADVEAIRLADDLLRRAAAGTIDKPS